MTYQSDVLATSPVLYWRLGESSGTSAADASGNGRNGTYNGSPTLGATGLLTGNSDTAVTFDGVNDYVSYSGTVLSAVAASTVAVWFKIPATPGSNQWLFRAHNGTATYFRALANTSGVLAVGVDASSAGSSALFNLSGLMANTRHFLAVTHSAGVATVYVDGVQVGSPVACLGTISVNAIGVGADSGGGSPFAGTEDEFAIWDTALSSVQIAALYTSGTAPPSPQNLTLDFADTTGDAYPVTVQNVPVGTTISRTIGRRLTGTPHIKVGGEWLATVGAAGDLAVKHGRNGPMDATWSMALGRTERPRMLVEGAPVEIYYGPECVWSGRLDAPDWNAATFAAIGAARDGEAAQCLTGAGALTSKPNTAIDAAKARGVVSWARVGDFGTADLSGVEGDGSNSDPDIDSINTLLNLWAIENDSQWRVTPDRRLIIDPEDETEPDWYVLPGTVVLGVAADEITDRVFLRYRSSVDDYLRYVSYPASTPVGGIERSASIQKRGPMSAARALTIATAMYRRLQAGRTGWTNGIDAHHGQIITKGGLLANLSAIRGGDTVRVLDHLDPRGATRHVDLVLEDVTWTPGENRVQLNPVGLAARTWESVMLQSRAVESQITAYGFENAY